MKAGTENRNKTIAAASLGMCALLGVGYMLYSFLGGGPAATPPPSIAPIAKTAAPANATPEESNNRPEPTSGDKAHIAVMPTGNAAGAAAKRIATSSASLDPTLDESAMLRTENLVYSGSGRNIFSSVYTPPPPVIPVAIASARKNAPPPPPVDLGPPPPPPPPPINLKFFGTATRANDSRQAFLLQGDDVFLASQGDIVARRYRIVSIGPNSIQVEDMANSNTQTLPLQK